MNRIRHSCPEDHRTEANQRSDADLYVPLFLSHRSPRHPDHMFLPVTGWRQVRTGLRFRYAVAGSGMKAVATDLNGIRIRRLDKQAECPIASLP